MFLLNILLAIGIEMPLLPYAQNALEPVISEQTINFHYDKHLRGYVNTLNTLIKGTALEDKGLLHIVQHAEESPIYNNAGQLLNHVLYFNQFRAPQENNLPKGRILAEIEKNFGSYDKFQEQFMAAATSLFGSGWVWLSQNDKGELVITKEANGGNPVRHNLNPILGLDVWEHAYYLDYQNRRADHIKAVWQIIDWNEVEKRLE